MSQRSKPHRLKPVLLEVLTHHAAVPEMTAAKTHKTKTYVLLFLLVFFGSVGNTILSKGMKDAGDLDISYLQSLEAGALRVLSCGTVWLGGARVLLVLIFPLVGPSWAGFCFLVAVFPFCFSFVP